MLIEFLPESSKFLCCENMVRDKSLLVKEIKVLLQQLKTIPFIVKFLFVFRNIIEILV